MPEVVVLPVPLTPTIMMTSGGVGGWVTGRATPSRICLELLLEELFELGAAGDAGAVGALAEVFEHDGGGGGADVGGEEDGLEVGDGGLVDLAGEGDDGGDGFGEGFAGAGDRLLHAVEEGAARGFFGGGVGSCGGFALAEAEEAGAPGRLGGGFGSGLGFGFGERFGGLVALAEEVEGHVSSLVGVGGLGGGGGLGCPYVR